MTSSLPRKVGSACTAIALAGTTLLLVGSAQATENPAESPMASATMVSSEIEPLGEVPCQRRNGDSASGWTCTTSRWESPSDEGGYDARATVSKNSTGGQVWASFYAYDEIFYVCDDFPNGHSTYAMMQIGNGPRIGPFTSSGGNCERYDLNIPEGMPVRFWVYTSDASVAVVNKIAAVGTS